MRLSAFAKINRSLEITGIRDDGYHLISSMMQAIDLCDSIEVSIDKHHSSHTVSISVDMQSDPAISEAISHQITKQEDNISYKAADMYINCLKPEFGGSIIINIHKKIPPAAGFGGGSSDAAAVLLALEYLFRENHSSAHRNNSVKKLMEIGVRLGADVPFCIAAVGKNNPEIDTYFADDEAGVTFYTAALCEGIGEKLTPIGPIAGSLIIINPAFDISAGKIYSLYDEESAGAQLSGPFGMDSNVLQQQAAIDGWGPNDLENVAIIACPETGRELTKAKDLAKSATRTCITGSGPSIICYYPEDTPQLSIDHDFEVISSYYENRADIRTVLMSKLLS